MRYQRNPEWEPDMSDPSITDIVCKHFLEAAEKKHYGWFWTCPNGGDACKYRHCLPAGHVLSRDVEEEEVEEEETIEEIIERERAALPPGGTPVTFESFQRWKESIEKRRVEAVEAKRVAEAKKTGGKGLHLLTGRDLFAYDPTLFVDDDDAAAEDDYEEDEAYWEEVVNQNQQTLNEANREAAEGPAKETTGAGSDEGEDCKRREGGGDPPIRADLFLDDGQLPDDLDQLDD
eukprot:GHVT01034262.1.p1 GENE.GHVT01034262.1~~GHVT01034262.1.p1  ORF type:complete len:233 (-),score=73.94 GHVT01034262.1:1018-1716(-)